MPAKWQQWMPFRIDAFKSSPAVQAMHPCARAGYLYLLACAWQTDDCTVPDDPIELADMSGLGDELWALHGPRILRKFGTGPGGRLQNSVCFEEWNEARRIFEARQSSANKTNSRSPNGHRTVTDGIAARSAYTRTGTVTGTETKTEKPKAPEMQAAITLMQVLGLASGDYDLKIMAQVIAFEAREAKTTPARAAEMLHILGKQGMERGEAVNTFWFKDRKFALDGKRANGHAPPNPGAQRQIERSEDEAKLIWESMSPAYKEANPWVSS